MALQQFVVKRAFPREPHAVVLTSLAQLPKGKVEIWSKDLDFEALLFAQSIASGLRSIGWTVAEQPTKIKPERFNGEDLPLAGVHLYIKPRPNFKGAIFPVPTGMDVLLPEDFATIPGLNLAEVRLLNFTGAKHVGSDLSLTEGTIRIVICPRGPGE